MYKMMIATFAMCGLATAAVAQEAETMSSDEVRAFIAGNSYTGFTPATNEAVATAIYRDDGTTLLTMADGTEQDGSYRFEGDAFCTRYALFRDGSENCFRLVDLGDGSAQAWRVDGTRALIMRPAD